MLQLQYPVTANTLILNIEILVTTHICTQLQNQLPVKHLYLDISQNLKFDMSRNEYISTISCFSSVRSLSHAWLFATPWTTAYQDSLSITSSQTLLKLMSIKLVMPSYHLNLCCLPLLLPSILLSIRILPNESVLCIRWPNYLSFSLNISPSNEYSGLICFRID